jgi:hypothetical protein
MSDFKPGDKVVCVETNNSPYLEKGRTYIVDILAPTISQGLKLEGVPNYWRASWFTRSPECRDILGLVLRDARNKANQSERKAQILFHTEGTTQETEDAYKQANWDGTRAARIYDRVRTRNMSPVQRLNDVLGMQ